MNATDEHGDIANPDYIVDISADDLPSLGQVSYVLPRAVVPPVDATLAQLREGRRFSSKAAIR